MYRLYALMSTQTLDGAEINCLLFFTNFLAFIGKVKLEPAFLPSYTLFSLNKTQSKV